MMIGLGVYLPFYMSLTAFLGSCIKLAYDKWAARRDAAAGLSDEEKAAKDAAFQEQGLVVAAACWAASPSSALSWRLSPWLKPAG